MNSLSQNRTGFRRDAGTLLWFLSSFPGIQLSHRSGSSVSTDECITWENYYLLLDELLMKVRFPNYERDTTPIALRYCAAASR